MVDVRMGDEEIVEVVRANYRTQQRPIDIAAAIYQQPAVPFSPVTARITLCGGRQEVRGRFPGSTGAPSGDLLWVSVGLRERHDRGAVRRHPHAVGRWDILEDILHSRASARARANRACSTLGSTHATPMVRVAWTLAWRDARRSATSEHSARASLRYTTYTPLRPRGGRTRRRRRRRHPPQKARRSPGR